tara:strand:+ start:100 stop:414 length:315 start_codon:yes stop_codon:yes gene_type:complete
MQSVLLSTTVNPINLSIKKHIKSEIYSPIIFPSVKSKSKYRDVYVKNSNNEHVIIAVNALAYISIMYYSYHMHNKHLTDIKILEKNVQMRKKKNLQYFKKNNNK